VAAEVLLAQVLREVPEGARVVAYADDILVLTRTKVEARATLHALQQALRRHPAGPLREKFARVGRACEGLDFLGWRFRVRRGVPRVEPTREAMARLRGGVWSKVRQAVDDGRPPQAALAYARDWARQFAPWEWPDVFVRMAVSMVDRQVQLEGRPARDLS